MKKYLVALVVVLFSFQAQAAVYVVQPNDTLTRISHLTGQSFSELEAMNNIANPDFIMTGQEIKYLNQSDLQAAKMWCDYMAPLSNAENARFFRDSSQELKNGDIRYSIFEHHGLHFDLVLAFANAWIKHNI